MGFGMSANDENQNRFDVDPGNRSKRQYYTPSGTYVTPFPPLYSMVLRKPSALQLLDGVILTGRYEKSRD